MPNWVDSRLEWLGDRLLPPRCVLCSGRGQSPGIDLCRRCEQLLPAAEPSVVDGPAPLRRSVAPFAYAHPLDHLVHALKYGRELAVGRVLGWLLCRHIVGAGLAVDIDLVLPVPLHPHRHAARGFNQSAEIAAWATRGLPCRKGDGLAIRLRDSPSQVGLSGDARRRNQAGAFAASGGVRGLRVAILDDVTTTGATLGNLAAALLESGAASVDAWCIARTGPPLQVDLAHDSEV